MILPKVVMIQDVRKCHNCKVGSIGDLELKEAYDRLCENGKLKDEYQIVERKGLTHALNTPTVFKTEWIKIVLSQIHEGYIWLEKGPVKITKRIVLRVIGYPTLEWSRAIKSDAKEVIEKNTGAQWKKRGMTTDTITNPLIDFVDRVIAHKFYQSSKINSIPCVAIDIGYKMVKRDHTYDVAELQIQQIIERKGLTHALDFPTVFKIE